MHRRRTALFPGGFAALWARFPACGLSLLLAGLARLDVQFCSNLGGAIARHIGPLLPVNRVAMTNLGRALPELDISARKRICVGMWDNLGRTGVELAHLGKLHRTKSGPGWEVAGEEHLRAALAAHGQLLFFSAHLGNWEMILPIAAALGIPVAGFYRAASNPFVDAVIQRTRAGGVKRDPTAQDETGTELLMFAKGAAGARAALRHLAAGGSLGMLVDQKMNDGISVPFFGQPAMTAPALAQLALRFACPVLPIRVCRLGPARVRLVCEPPLNYAGLDVPALTAAMSATVERWIREDPSAWLWMHRRWPKDGPKDRAKDTS